MSDSSIRRFDDVSWRVPVSKREDLDWDHPPADDEAGPAGVTFLVTRQGVARYQEA
jgi:hypothetical protein